MPNKYKYDYTLEDKINEEDRELKNDLLRQQISYYTILTGINSKILSVLNRMSDDEIKRVLLNNGLRVPVTRL